MSHTALRTPCADIGSTTTHAPGRSLEELRAGLARGDFFVLFEPVVDAATGHLDGFEALVRWAHPDCGVLAPGAFIPQLESDDALSDLTAFVLRQSCSTAATWPALTGRPLRVRVNVSIAELEQPWLVDAVRRTLAATGLDPARLVLEVTETGRLRRVRAAQATCARLRRLGVRLALDDFGCGVDDDDRLTLLPVDELKVDRSVVAHVGDRPAAAAELTRILGFGAALSMPVTVEGVERTDQLAQLLESGAPLLQGHLFGRPTRIAGLAHVESLDERAVQAVRTARLATRQWPAGADITLIG